MKIYNLLYILLLILLTGCNSIAQKNDSCNRNVWMKKFEPLIPAGVCIPNDGYHISEVYERIDLNGDGLKDFIFDWNKKSLNDGDTIFVSLYIQNSDSTFSHYRTFDNLYPVYFKSYDLDYMPQDDNLVSLQRKYEGEYQFVDLKFEINKIYITVKHEAKEDLMIEYLFDKNKKDWQLKKAELHDYALDKINSYDLANKIGYSINEFTYFYWEK